jgi:hypothetical protein
MGAAGKTSCFSRSAKCALTHPRPRTLGVRQPLLVIPFNGLPSHSLGDQACQRQADSRRVSAEVADPATVCLSLSGIARNRSQC